MNSQILRVSESLSAVFQQAQETNSVRCFEVSVEGETLAAKSTYPIQSGAKLEEEWAAIQTASSTPALLLFHIACTNGPWKWILVAFVCDNLPAREKMLYASARDCLKQQLGLAYFVGDVHTTDVRTFSYHDLVATMHNTSGPLSEREVLLKEEAALERDLSVKASAMNVMPFGLTADCRAALDAFTKDTASRWLSLRIKDEELTVGSSIPNMHEDQVNSAVEKQTPSFVVYRYTGSAVDGPTTLFLYVCPEEANVRLKMTYSTAKASLLSDLQQRGIKVDKMIEITDTSNVLDSIHADFASAAVTADEDNRPKSFSRPAAPGRGRGRGRRA
ncbi:Aste57867_19609 [Aphanomyces stellatus]|uniref:Aste57867_19609 protein n=1 Tax=Aphanomyces stellatus TaxID=120398 RepID=A0A485LD04_9STRA|nr:hypothetical protein As57867_019545 [Aphanomyces stellatus]VFT96310.1 Aste57867_19609 [Aphanomyces stellatus]